MRYARVRTPAAVFGVIIGQQVLLLLLQAAAIGFVFLGSPLSFYINFRSMKR